MNNIFDSNRIFQIWIYTVSHAVLILRSVNNSESEMSGYNIDVEFWGVGYLDLPDILNGAYIKEVKENIPEKFTIYSSSRGFKIFEIKSEGNLFYIAAAGYIAGKNSWDSDRVLNPNLEYNEIIASS